MTTDRTVAGWDLGGAHLKVALAAPGRQVLEVEQIPCPLWQGLDRLTEAIDQARGIIGDSVARHAVTMTGELVDLFDNRAQGVGRLIDAMTKALPESRLRIYGGKRGFLTCAEALNHTDNVASANWRASAEFVAANLDDALFIDLGSTTTDIVPVARAGVCVAGETDGERMTAEELVYTGVTRTPVMALAEAVPFEGARQRLMAEYFATAADIHRLTGRLPEGVDQLPAADSGEKDLAASARRLARMLGRDLEDAPMERWRSLAGYIAEQQLQLLQEAAALVMSRQHTKEDAPVVGAGIGRFLVEDLAARLDRPYRDFASLVSGSEAVRNRAAHCAPATAVALLAMDGP